MKLLRSEDNIAPSNLTLGFARAMAMIGNRTASTEAMIRFMKGLLVLGYCKIEVSWN
jgi:hypothetical protein